jgi:hypothetical protein
MRRIVWLLVVLLWIGVAPGTAIAKTMPGPPAPVPGSPGYCALYPKDLICSHADGGTVVVNAGGATPVKTEVPGPPGAPGQPVTVVPHDTVGPEYAPTCTGNSYDGDALCGAAVSTCQPTGQGIIRYWMWLVTRHPNGTVVSAVIQPGTYCLGPASPGVSPIVLVAAAVERDFKSLVVVKGSTVVRPKGTTLVNYPTQFSTDAHAYTLPAVQILGHTVVVTATPKQFDWYFGDGASAEDAGPGQASDSDVTHTYQDTGAVTAHVEITWTGTFTVDGGAPRAVLGTARTVGPGTALQVKQARAELIGG